MTIKAKRLNKTGKKKNQNKAVALKRAELKLEKKKSELLKVKALHKKLAIEFIDLWMTVRKLQKATTIK